MDRPIETVSICSRRRFVVLFFLFVFPLFLSVPGSAVELPEKQKILSDRYAQLEQILYRMSEVTASSNPKRAAILKKVLLASKDKLMTLRFEKTVRTLEGKHFTEAVSEQEAIEKELVELLRLLESENRDQQRELEKEKIKEFLRHIEELIHQEKNLKNRTAQLDQPQSLEQPQKDIRLKTQTLKDQIAEHEDPTRKKSKDDSKEAAKDKKPENEKKESEADPDAKKNSNDPDKKDAGKEDAMKQDGAKSEENKEKKGENPSDGKKEEDKKEGGENKNGEQKDGDKSKESKENKDGKDKDEGEKKQDEKKENGESQDVKPANETPGQQSVRQAAERMKQAEEKLNKAEKGGALEEQEEAIAQLQRAKAELEKILRQLREEELMQTLETLQARFKRMIRLEQTLRALTEKLGSTPKKEDESEQRQRQIESSRLASEQQVVIDDADAALVLLREDGTAQAMAESLLQTRFDMEDVVDRLKKTQLGEVTLKIEDTVIASLQEMLEAVDLAIKEAQKRKEDPTQQPDGVDGGKQDEPLIQLLSELKMIRSMQKRVNDRTERYEKQIDELKAQPDADLLQIKRQVEELTRQQNRISRILHDIKVGKIQ